MEWKEYRGNNEGEKRKERRMKGTRDEGKQRAGRMKDGKILNDRENKD